jgi:hypothetical protein
MEATTNNMGKVDTILSKWVSRKFIVFALATILHLFADITSGDWVMIAGIYIGGQSVVDLASMYKSKL